MKVHPYLCFGLTRKHMYSKPDGGNVIRPRTEDEINNYLGMFQHSTVFVWEPVNGVGHSSMMILANGVEGNGEKYISSWPSGKVLKRKKGGSKIAKSNTVGALLDGFYHDCLLEGDHEREEFRYPEHAISLPSLNHVAMWNRARSLEVSSGGYNFLRWNCSTVVASVLRAGLSYCQAAYLFRKSHKVVWTPTELVWFAKAAERLN